MIVLFLIKRGSSPPPPPLLAPLLGFGPPPLWLSVSAGYGIAPKWPLFLRVIERSPPFYFARVFNPGSEKLFGRHPFLFFRRARIFREITTSFSLDAPFRPTSLSHSPKLFGNPLPERAALLDSAGLLSVFPFFRAIDIPLRSMKPQ